MEKIMENKSQTKVLGVVVVAVGLLWFGVQDASSDPIDSLLGDWRTLNLTTITYTEDGKWSAQHGWWGEESFNGGSFTFDGETLTFFTDTGGRACEEGQIGVYRASIGEDEVTLELIDDPCNGRSSDFIGGMVRSP
jgi:hypothetical protein